MSNNDSFDDFFNDDLNLDDPQFPDDDFSLDDDNLLADDTTEEEGGGISRTVTLILGLLAIIFVILVAVVVAILVSGGEECDANCLLATEIVATNNQISTEIRSSETAVSIQSTETRVAVETLDSQSTATAIFVTTATQSAVEAAIAATDTQVAQDATATQVAVNEQVAQTQTAVAVEAFTDTPTPEQDVIAQILDENNQPAREGLVICIFRDNGDEEFNPSSDVDNPNCSPTLGQGGTGSDTITTPTTSAPAATASGLNPIFQTATANAGGGTGSNTTTGSDTTSGANTTTGNDTGSDTTASQASATPASGGGAPNSLNPIFQTATAAAAGNSAGGLPTPTPEGGASRQGRPLARVVPNDDTKGVPQQDGGDDEFVGNVVVDANGNITLPSLPPGQYWFSVGSQEFNINVTDTVSTQTFTFPVDGQPGQTITITVPGANAAPPPTAEGGSGGPATLEPIFQTATALASGGTPVAASPSPELDGTPTELTDTGFFDGTSEVGAVDLMVLAIIGAVLIAVVVTARRMRTSL